LLLSELLYQAYVPLHGNVAVVHNIYITMYQKVLVLKLASMKAVKR